MWYRLCLAGLLGFCVAEPAWSAWRDDAEAHIARHQTMPRSAEIRGERCTVRVLLTVDVNGMIQNYEIGDECRSAILIRATDNLLFRLPQFPRPPGGKGAQVRLPVTWPPQE